MLYWEIMLLAVAIVAAILGFAGVAVGSAGIAKMLFVLFTALFAVSVLGDNWTRRSIS